MKRKKRDLKKRSSFHNKTQPKKAQKNGHDLQG
jgi:hypothetical protein